MGALLDSVVLLTDSGNKPAVRVIGRSSFEFCAHAYYVKKHMKQHLDRQDFAAAWSFLLPIATGSRYMNEYHHPEERELFPAPPHIAKAVNCFREVMPRGMGDDYSYLSEFCHPNPMTLQQHYRWATSHTIEFEDHVEFGAFGAIAGSSIQGLVAIRELLTLGNEQQVSGAIVTLLAAVAEQCCEGKT